MHILFKERHGLDEAEVPTDLGQTPADLLLAGKNRPGGPQD